MTDQAAKQGRAARSMVGVVALVFAFAIAPTAASAASLPVVSATSDYTCAITSDGILTCWGSNGNFEADDPANVPPTGKTWAMVSVGNSRACGVTTDGDGYCWGSGSGVRFGRSGAFGGGEQSFGAPPAGQKWASISTALYHSCGVTTTGAGYCWGRNLSGAASVPSENTWKQITTGGESSCGITTAGRGVCWGARGMGSIYVLGTLLGGKTWSSISPGPNQTCGVTTDGQGYCWEGWDTRGEIGFPSGRSWSSISPGDGYTCGITTSGEGLCWGSRASRISDVPAGNEWASISVTRGGSQSCGVTADGRLYCWGPGATSVPEGQFPSRNPSWNPPTVTSAPAGRVNPTLTPVSVAFEGAAGTTFECSIDSGAFVACTSPVSNNASTEGEHRIAIRQIDGDRKSDPRTIRWTVDTTAPAKPGLSGRPTSPTKSTGASLTMSGEANATFTCSLDGADYAPCTSPISLTGLADGTHTLRVKQSDQAGNAGLAETATWTVDTTAPAKPGLSGASSSPTRSTSASFTITGEPNAKFTCSLDGAPYTPCTSPRNLTGLKEGTHTLGVKQTDQVGNTGPAETATWTIDTTAPAKPVLSGTPISPTKSTGASLTITGEANAKFTCSLDGAAYESCVSPLNLTGLVEGTHTLSVKQADEAGNSGPAETATWTIDTSTPARPGLSGAPSSPTRSTDASFTFTGEANATFTCSLDGADSVACTSPVNLTGLSEGTHTFAVKQTDQAGNTSRQAATATWIVDTTPPAKPGLSGTPTSPTKSTGASFTMTGEANAKFTCSLDGAAYTSCTSPRILTGLAEGTHTVSVKQTDEAGNSGPAETATWTVDTTAPAKPGLSGTPSSPTRSTDASFTFTGEANANFTCSLDGAAYTSCAPPQNLTGLPDGTHSFRVRQTDEAGNTGPAEIATWKSDTTPPAKPGLSSTPTSPTKSTSATFTITGEASATFTCSLDGADYAPCTSPISLTGLAEGTHTLSAKQTDEAGNSGPAETATWTVDTTAPDKPGLSGTPTSPTKSTSATLTITGEANAKFTCSLDGAAYTSCTSPRTLTGLSEGTHTFAVKQADQAGNTGPAETVTWTVDITPPVAPTLSSGPSGSVYGSTATFGFTGAGAVGLTCALDGQASNPCTSPVTFENLAVGMHTFSVAAVDAAGNASSATTRRWTVLPDPPTITSAPSGTINPTRTPATVTFTGVAGAKFQCSKDNGAWTACTSPFAFGTAGDGPHSLQVRQVVSRSSVAAFVSEAASASWKVDTVAPSKPSLSGVPAANTTSGGAAIAITAEAGATLECRIDGAAASACSSPVELTGLADGVHTLSVTATDAVGNVSAPAVATWRVDTVAPGAPTFTGQPNPITGLTTATFAFRAESGASLRCSIDGGTWAQCTSPRALSNLSTGDHSFAVKAVDAAGNASDAATAFWAVETKAPPAAVLDAKPDETSGSSTATFSITPPPYSTLTCSLDNAPFTTCTTNPSFTGLRVGKHTFQVKVTRGAAAATTSYTWTIDLSVPAKPVWASAPSGYFGFSGTAGMTFECSIDSGAFAACTSPLKIPSLPDGDHTISIRQKSANGKVSAPLVGTWTVDVAGRVPTVTGTSVNAYQTLLLGDQRWHVKAQLVVSAGGTNANSVLSLAQVSWSVSKPAATPVPTVASDPDGVYDWQGLDVQVPAGEIVVGETIPTWIRVGTVGGQWTDWLPVTTD